MKGIGQPTYFKNYKYNFDYNPDRHSILHLKKQKPMDLTRRIQIKEYEGVVVIEVQQLLEE